MSDYGRKGRKGQDVVDHDPRWARWAARECANPHATPGAGLRHFVDWYNTGAQQRTNLRP